MRINTFQTGRGYTDHGQRIAFIELPDRRAYFVDVDRGIDGVVPAPIFDDQPVDARHVLAEYDAGRYEYDHEARLEHWADLGNAALGILGD